MKTLLSVLSLLLSTALLLIGHGMQLTLLPLRAAVNGMSELLIGVSASCYFLGFVVGCLAIPRLIARVGHIRAFAVLTSVMISVLLSLEMLDQAVAWLGLRFMTGVAVSGLYTVIESWLNSQASAENRGRILSIYTFITLASLTLGQFLINVGPVASSVPFTLAGLFLALAILPVGLTRRMSPAPVEATRVSFGLLYRKSHSAFTGAAVAGLVVGSFWSLGAVYASRASASQAEITWFMSAAILGGALLQYPIGWLSDRVDRRRVLTLLCLAGTASSLAVFLSAGQAWFLATVFLFGACVMPVYSISLATAADVSASDEFLVVGTSVLMLNALVASVAPLLLGQLMTLFGPGALFLSFSVICLLAAGLFLVLTRQPRAVAISEQVPFTAAAPDVAPASFDLDPRARPEATDS